MKNETKKIKSKFLIGLATTFMVGGSLFAGCAVKQDDVFSTSELIVSVGEDIKISDYLKSQFSGDLVSSDESVFTIDEGEIAFISNGLAYLYAMQGQEKIAYIKILVKDSFLTPSNIFLQSQNCVKWDISSVSLNGQIVNAQYEAKINGGSYHDEVVTCQTNELVLRETGTFEISVRAIGNDVLDGSDWSEAVVIKNIEQPQSEGISFVADRDNGAVSGRLSWPARDGARYRVVIGSILSETNQNYFDVDLQNLVSTSVLVRVEAISEEDEILWKDEINVSKLSAPTLNYLDGMIYWGRVTGAQYYLICVENVLGGTKSWISTESTSTYLEGVSTGKYNVSVQAVGSGKVLNSSLAKVKKSVAKIGGYETQISRDDNIVNIKISTNSTYLNRFAIYEGETKIKEVSLEEVDGAFVAEEEFEIDEFGMFEYYVQALPTKENDIIVPVDGTEFVVSSDLSEHFVVYNLAQIENITHKIIEGKSIFEFDEIEFADDYVLMINGHEVEFEKSVVSGKVELNVGVLDREELEIVDGSTISIEIEPVKDHGEVISVKTTKEMRVLSAPTRDDLLSGSYAVDKIYNWNVSADANLYKYEIYRAQDSSFDIEGVEPEYYSASDNVTDIFEEGFYVIRVYASSFNEDEFLTSKNYLEDRFMVSTKIEGVEYSSFNYNAGRPNFTFEVSALEQGKNYQRVYEIYIEDQGASTLLSSGIVNQSSSYSYSFTEDINLETAKKIKVRIVCPEVENQKIYYPSDFAVLNLEKAASPVMQNVIVDDDQILSLVSGNKTCLFVYGGTILRDENEDPLQEIDLKNYAGDFSIKVKFAEEKDFADEGFASGNYCAESDELLINFSRSAVPENLSFENGNVSLTQQQPYESIVYEIKIKSLNDQVGKEWVYKTNATNFALDSLKTHFASDQFFSFYYDQKTEVLIKAYSFINQYDGEPGCHYLPSVNETSDNKGKVQITIKTLENVGDLDYNKSSNKLIWTSQNNEESTTYDVYVGGSVYRSVSVPDSKNGNVSSYSLSLNEFNFEPLQEYEFRVVARSVNNFRSNYSNSVVIQKLAQLQNVIIKSFNSGNEIKLSWNLPANVAAKSKGLAINDGADVLPTAGQANVSGSVSQYSFKVLGQNSFTDESNGKKYFFVDSNESIFELLNALQTSYMADSAVSDGKLMWSRYLKDDSIISGASDINFDSYKNLIKYRVAVNYVGGATRTKDIFAKESILDSKNFLTLNDEVFFGGEIENITITAYLDDYTLARGNKGIYLCQEIATLNLRVERLNAVENLGYSYIGEESTTIDEELARKIRVAWDYDETGVSFEVSYGGNTITTENKFVDITQNDLEQGSIIAVKALSGNKIPSEQRLLVIQTANALTATITDRGVLQINDNALSNTYLVHGEFNGATFDIRANSKNIDIFDYLKLTENVDADYLELKLSYVAIGKVGAIVKTNDEITKNVLVKKNYSAHGREAYFDGSFAGGVTIVSSNEQLNAGTTQKIEYVESEGLLSATSATNYGVAGETKDLFVLEISNQFNGEKFDYFYSKTGFVDSWYDRTLSENYIEASVSEFSQLSDVNFVAQNGEITLKTQSINDGTKKLVVDLIYITGNYFVGRFEFDGTEFNLSQIEEILNRSGSRLNAGEYRFEIVKTNKSLSEGNFAYSSKYSFTATQLANQISNVRIDSKGFLIWNNSSRNNTLIYQGGTYYVIDEKILDIRRLIKESDGYHFMVANSSNLNFDGVPVATSEMVYIPSRFDQVELVGIESTPDIQAITQNSDASLTLKFDSNINFDQNLILYAIYQDGKYAIDYERSDDNSVISVKYLSIYEALKGVMEDRLTSIKLFAVCEDCFKSRTRDVELDIRRKNDAVNSVLEMEKAGNYDDYLIYNSDVNSPTSVWVKLMNETGRQISLTSHEFLTGYYVYESQRNDVGFYAERPMDDVETSRIEAVKALNITKIMEEIANEGFVYKIQVAPVHSGPIQIEWLSELRLTRLLSVDTFEIDGDYVKWSQDVEMGQTGYKIEKNSNGASEYEVFDPDAEGILYSNFVYGANYDVKISTVSQTLGLLSSNSKEIEGLTKARVLTSGDFDLNDGVLSLKWNMSGLTSSEKNAVQNESISSHTEIDKIFETKNLFKILEAAELKMGSGYYGKSELADMVLNTKIELPISFKLSELESAKIALKFSGNEDSYTIFVNAVDILKRISSKYIEILTGIAEALEGVNESDRETFENIVELLDNESKFNGVATDRILFDEMSDGDAENISAGYYALSAWQLSNNEITSIRSDENEIRNSVEVLPAPIMKTYKEDIKSASGEVLRSNYSLKFKPIKDGQNQDKTKYVLLLRNEEALEKSVEIEYKNSEWVLKGESSDLTLSEDEDGFVVIPLNSRELVVGIDQICELDCVAYDAIIYATGSGSQLNSKSDRVRVSYLGLNDISLNLGKIRWAAFSDASGMKDTRVIYMKKDSGVYRTMIVQPNEVGSFTLEATGEYDFVMFMSAGQITETEIDVDSKIVLLENVVKLESPEVEVEEGVFKITDAQTNVYDGYVRKYFISNASSGSRYFITGPMDEVGYYYTGQSHFNDETAQEYSQTEYYAQRFYFEALGSQDIIEYSETITKLGFGEVEVYRPQSSSKIFMRSNKIIINAEMLQEITLSLNADGDISWNSVSNSILRGLDLQEGQKILYKVEVSAYRIANTLNGNEYVIDESLSEVIYTDGTTIPTERLRVPSDGTERAYKFKISAMAYVEGNSGETITTLEGSTFTILNGATYQPGQPIVLRGAQREPSVIYSRVSAAEGIRVEDGVIKWTYSGASESNFKVYASTSEDMSSKVELTGNIQNSGQTYIFDPDSELALNTRYYIFVKTIGGSGQLSSKIARSENKFYKLPNISASDVNVSYRTISNTIQYEIDFTSYKNKLVDISNNKDYFNLKIKVRGFEDEFVVSATNPKLYVLIGNGQNTASTIYLPNGDLEMEITPISLSNIVINAEKSETFSLIAPEWSEADEIVWDEDSASFVWTFGKGRNQAGQEALFDVEITTKQLVSRTSNSTQERIITRKYNNLILPSFTPVVQGTITSFIVRAKRVQNGFVSSPLSYGEDVELSLYSGGSGTENSPYLISSANDFKNIELRTQKDAALNNYEEKYYIETRYKNGDIQTTSVTTNNVQNEDGRFYFLQTADIELAVEGTAISSDFEGVYDGGGNKLVVTGSLSTDVEVSIQDSAETYNFAKGFGVFKKVSTIGLIKNLTLQQNYNFTETQNLIYGGLVIINQGTIDEVECDGFTFTFGRGVNENDILSMAQIAGVNEGVVSNCKNESDITITNSKSGQGYSKQTLSGFVIENSGLVFGCENSKNIEFNISNGNGVNVKLSAVVLLNKSGEIELCGNSGNVSSTNQNGMSYVGGLVNSSRLGSIKYCWNTGAISGYSAGGIAYQMTNSILDYVFACGKANENVNKAFFDAGSTSTVTNSYTFSNYNGQIQNGITRTISPVSVIYTTASLRVERITGTINSTYDSSTRIYSVTFTEG